MFVMEPLISASTIPFDYMAPYSYAPTSPHTLPNRILQYHRYKPSRDSDILSRSNVVVPPPADYSSPQIRSSSGKVPYAQACKYQWAHEEESNAKDIDDWRFRSGPNPAANFLCGTGDASVRRQASSSVERQQGSLAIRSPKLNQVIQNFYGKAAQIVIQARQPVAPLYSRGSTTRRLNKWFNIDTMDTDDFREDLKLWKSVDVSAPLFTRLPALVVEVVLQTRDLTPNQSLVLLGGNGQRWNVDGGNGKKKLSSAEIVLERWTVDWEPTIADATELPVIYKKSIVVFRSLFTLSRLLPAWKLRKRLAKSKLIGNSLKVTCRVGSSQSGLPPTDVKIPLTAAVVLGQEPRVERHGFHNVETPAGKLCTSVEYRSDCNFRIDDSEAHLSSQFLTSDRRTSSGRSQTSGTSDTARHTARRGSSLSNYNSALNAFSSNNSLPYTSSAEGRTGSSPSLMRSERGQSVTYIPPFKTASLSASPSFEQFGKSPFSLARTSSAVSMERAGSRAGTYSHSQRNPNSLGDSTGFSLSGSPRAPSQMPPQLIKRYSSSFGQRSTSFSGRRRPSQASDSAIQLDSTGSRGSSGSPSTMLQFDEAEDDLATFVKLLDTRSPLTGSQFKADSGISSRIMNESVVQRTRSELSRFQELKESHAVLSESLMQSISTQSSTRYDVGHKRTSPSPGLGHNAPSPFAHPLFPHTPSIPSKLSESSVIPQLAPQEVVDETTDCDRTYGQITAVARAINIPLPLSPRLPARTKSSSFDDRSEAFLHAADSSSRKSFSLGSSLSNRQVTSALSARDSSVAENDSSTIPIDTIAANTHHTPEGFASRGSFTVSLDVASNDHSMAHLRSARSSRSPAAEHARSTDRPPTDDDELFFAMSDIHMKNN